MRFTRKNVPGQEQEQQEEIILGEEGKPFTFDQADISIEWCETSTQNGEIEPIKQHILNQVK